MFIFLYCFFTLNRNRSIPIWTNLVKLGVLMNSFKHFFVIYIQSRIVICIRLSCIMSWLWDSSWPGWIIPILGISGLILIRSCCINWDDISPWKVILISISCHWLGHIVIINWINTYLTTILSQNHWAISCFVSIVLLSWIILD
jgi:hypothetical protein